MAETDECAHLACLRMAEVTVMHSVMTRATGSIATVIGLEYVISPFGVTICTPSPPPWLMMSGGGIGIRRGFIYLLDEISLILHTWIDAMLQKTGKVEKRSARFVRLRVCRMSVTVVDQAVVIEVAVRASPTLTSNSPQPIMSR